MKNVFDIQQGVTIAFFVKRGGEDQGRRRGDIMLDSTARARLSTDWLNGHDRRNTEWRELRPSSPFYFSCHRKKALSRPILRFLIPSAKDVFPLAGGCRHKDHGPRRVRH